MQSWPRKNEPYMSNLDQTSGNSVLRNVHIGPEATGDNIDGLRAPGYVFDPNNGTGVWSRALTPFINTTYDTVNLTNPDGNGNYQTITFKYSGSTVRTLTLTFDVNSNVTSIARS